MESLILVKQIAQFVSFPGRIPVDQDVNDTEKKRKFKGDLKQ